ncbi:hypothetical protein E4U61_005998 [Claviceps capensis]|nr:hypothetical protein E4U61_005998 [Claviceps capensis]
MHTVRQRDKLAPELILLDTPVPTLAQASEEEVLVKVAATALCSGELEWASRFPDIFPQDKEPVPGQDIAGTVVVCGPKSAFHAGDEVFCRIDASRPGGMREYTVALESEMAMKPASMDWISAAATPLSALTAWQALFCHGSLEKGALFGGRQVRARNATKKSSSQLLEAARRWLCGTVVCMLWRQNDRRYLRYRQSSAGTRLRSNNGGGLQKAEPREMD